MSEVKSESKLKSRDIQIILVICGFVLLFFSYQFGYKNLSSSTEKVQKEVDDLTSRKNELTEQSTKKEDYSADIEVMTSHNKKMMESLPKEITMEAVINYIITLSKKYTVDINSIAMEAPTKFFTFTEDGKGTVVTGTATGAATTTAATPAPATTTTNAGTTTTPQDSIYKTKITLNYSASYDDIKGMIDELNKAATHLTLEEIAMNYSADTGGLSGSATVAAYTTDSSEGREYTSPSFDVDLGTNNIFSSY